MSYELHSRFQVVIKCQVTVEASSQEHAESLIRPSANLLQSALVLEKKKIGIEEPKINVTVFATVQGPREKFNDR